MTNVKRSRGYAWEDKVVKIFKEKGFTVYRFGGPHQIDVSAHNGKVIIAIECKSTVGNTCLVPEDQIDRCYEWAFSFSKYEPLVVLAFKFGNKGRGKQRAEKTYFKIWNMKMVPRDITCNYDGYCKVKETGKDLWLEDFEV